MTIRISGLASGIDTESMVNELMQAHRTQVDAVYQKRQLLEWRQEDYREINTKLLALRTSVFDMKLQGSFNTKSVTSSDQSVLTATASSSAVEGNFTVQVVQLARGASKESTPVSSDYEHSGDEASFTLTGKNGSAEITVEVGDTLSSIVTKINAQSTATGIKATYDSGTNKFYLFSSDTGSDAVIQVADTDGFLAGVLNMNLDDLQGQDAVIKFNGGSDLSFSSNQFTVNNISFNLFQEDKSVNLTVGKDIDSIVEKISDFVDKYNSVVDYMAGKMQEKRCRDYAPLTDEQKDEMTEKEIELWEEKARSGLLRGDSLLSSVYNRIRMSTSSAVEGLTGSYTTLNSIGITTLAWNDNGKLYIDESDLRAALSEEPEAVMELFTTSGSTDSTNGIAERLYTVVNANMNNIINKAGSSISAVDNSYLGREIARIDNRIETMEDRLVDLEERYWKQFTAMEQALQKMQTQSQWLTQQLGGNNS